MKPFIPFPFPLPFLHFFPLLIPLLPQVLFLLPDFPRLLFAADADGFHDEEFSSECFIRALPFKYPCSGHQATQ